MRYTHGPKRSGGRRGAGLVEAMIGLAIMATSMAGTCRVVLQAKQVSDMARSHYTAAAIAKNRITLAFGSEEEKVSSLTADFQQPPT